MKILKILHASFWAFFYRAAERQINPMHDDVIEVALKNLEYSEKLRRLMP